MQRTQDQSKEKEAQSSRWGSRGRATNITTTSIARGRAVKKVNALTACLCGALPGIALGIFQPVGVGKWLIGFIAGFMWANAFEYVYHRFLLHLPKTFFAQRHLEHHASVGTPTEAEHVNFGSSPLWVAAIFAINSVPMAGVNVLLGLDMAPGILLAFSVYFVAVEEIHWRIHLGEWLLPGLRRARGYHLVHHVCPNARFNIFLPLCDMLFGSATQAQ